MVGRSTAIRSLYELWECAPTKEELCRRLLANPLARDPLYCGADRSFRIQVESYNRKIASQLKVAKIEELAFLAFEGDVNLKSPDNSFHLIEFYGIDNGCPSVEPERVYFGRWLCDGNRRLIDRLNLSDRKFISNTSMDATLSLIMANLAGVRPNDLVLDPFVGSGSLLVAAAQFGAYVMGCDIDYLLLHGLTRPTKKGRTQRDPDEGVQANLKQYGLEARYLDVLVGDSSLPFWREGGQFDVIMTDPPYGIREASVRVGQKEQKKVPEECLAAHVPAKIAYKIDEILGDLLRFAGLHLKPGGRLVFWMPVPGFTYTVDQLPSDARFELLYHAGQKICRQSLRVLVCMQKKSATEQLAQPAERLANGSS